MAIKSLRCVLIIGLFVADPARTLLILTIVIQVDLDGLFQRLATNDVLIDTLDG